MSRAPLTALACFVFRCLALDAATTPKPDPTNALSNFLVEAVRDGDVPGVVVLVVSAEREIFHEAFGKMDVAAGVAMRKDAIFRIASMTKPITSTAVMMLVEEGRIGLDDEVARYLPAFESPRVISRVDLAAGTYETRPATRRITIRQLLTHTSGIDPQSQVGVIVMMQLLPFYDEAALSLLRGVESRVYQHLLPAH